MDDVAELVNKTIRKNIRVLKEDYSISDRQENTIYKNIERILDTSITKYDFDVKDYDKIGSVWRFITSKYLKDLTCLCKEFSDFEIRDINKKDASMYVEKIFKGYNYYRKSE